MDQLLVRVLLLPERRSGSRLEVGSFVFLRVLHSGWTRADSVTVDELRIQEEAMNQAEDRAARAEREWAERRKRSGSRGRE